MMKPYQKRIAGLTAEAIEELRAIGITTGKIIFPPVINTRAKKRLGCCKVESRKGERIYHIEISAMLAEQDDRRIKEVILHELLHTCPGCLNHGKAWKDLVDRVNCAYGYHITVTAAPDFQHGSYRLRGADAPSYRYMIVCKTCDKRIYRMRKSRVVACPGDYRCSCGGKLEVFTIKQ